MTRFLKSQYQYHHLNIRQTLNTKWIFYQQWSLARSTHLQKLNLNTSQLILSQKIITFGDIIFGGHKPKCHGWGTSPVLLYICNRVDQIYFSRQDCLETKTISSSFPYSMLKTTSLDIVTLSTSQTPRTKPSQLQGFIHALTDLCLTEVKTWS